MQVALRANVLSAFVPARRRIGYDRSRAKDLHGLFINERIADRPGIHVLDAIGSFCEPLGLNQTEVVWDLPVPEAACEWARAQWADDGKPTLMISPCSSPAMRCATGIRNVTPPSPTMRRPRAGGSSYAAAAANWNATLRTRSSLR